MSTEESVWPRSISSLLLLFHFMPDMAGARLFSHARFAALRALQVDRLDVTRISAGPDLDRQLFDFFRRECGQSNNILHQLEELRRDTGGRGVIELAAEKSGAVGKDVQYRAVACSSASAASLGLSAVSDSMTLSSAVPPTFQPSSTLYQVREKWSMEYAAKWPHRKLIWRPLLGSGLIRWKHRKGWTDIVVSELQMHLLLALNSQANMAVESIRAAVSTWESSNELIWMYWERALSTLCSKTGPLERGSAADDRVSVKAEPSSDMPFEFDFLQLLAPKDGWATAGDADREQSDVKDTGVIDAAIVRLLKRWHILSADELVSKLAEYPESLEAAGVAKNCAAGDGFAIACWSG